MDSLTNGLAESGDHRKIDNKPGTFMAVHVERIGKCNLGPMFSVAHYYEQNGDLMKDPDMVFIRGVDGNYHPIEFQQDNVAFYSRAVTFNEKGEVSHYYPAVQKDMVDFANHWMLNIAMQQHITPVRETTAAA